MAAQHALVVCLGFAAALGTCAPVTPIGCATRTCTGIDITPVYSISVRDADTHAPICDAVVQIWTSTAKTFGCKYIYEIPKDVDEMVPIEVSRAGYKSVTKEVSTDYEVDSCGHARRKAIVIDLEKL